MLSKKIAAIAAAALITASSTAVAQSVPAPYFADQTRAGAEMDEANELGRGRGGTILIVAAILIGLGIWGIIKLTKDDEDPVSP